MPQPTPYTRTYDFTGYQEQFPAQPLPAAQVDAQLDLIGISTGQMVARQALIQRDDGKLRNKLVTPDTLSNTVLAMLGTTMNPRGDWEADGEEYKKLDLVSSNGVTYIAVLDHSSGASFAADFDLGYWLLFSNPAVDEGTSYFQKFSGTGAQTVFNTTNDLGVDSNALMVFVDNGGGEGLEIMDPEVYTIDGTELTFDTAPTMGTNNIYVFAPSLLLGAVGSAVADAIAAAVAAGVSETNAGISAGNALTSANNAASSALAAASAAAEGLYNEVVTITSADSPYTPTDDQEGYLFRCDTTGGAITINLNSLATYAEDMKFGFVKVTNDGNDVTINRGGSDTINGGNSAVLSQQYETHALIGDLASSSWIDIMQVTGIPDGSVTNVKLADMAEATFKMRAAGSGTGAPVDGTAAQATAALDSFTGDSGSGGVKGLVPAPAAGDTAAGKFLKADGTFAVPQTVKNQTAVNTTSGANIDLTGIPSGAKRFTIGLDRVQTNGTALPFIQLGDIGGFENTNYFGGGFNPSNYIANSISFPMLATHAVDRLYSGIITGVLMDASTNTWAISIIVGSHTSSGDAAFAGGSKSLSDPLTQIRLGAGGSDNFDGGKIGLSWEF